MCVPHCEFFDTTVHETRYRVAGQERVKLCQYLCFCVRFALDVFVNRVLLRLFLFVRAQLRGHADVRVATKAARVAAK
jgi:hypothetical protein